MTQASTIEWTDATWNPVRGCVKISAGCKHCYAEEFAERWRGTPGHPYEQGFALRLMPGKLLEPLRLTTPKRIFVNSMSDLFAEGVPDDYVALVAEVMRAASWHLFQVLTKRATRLRALAERGMFEADNIIVGVTAENRKDGLPRVDQLRATRARHRFVSCEPLLEHLGELDLEGIEWVIVGGESGRSLTVRPMHPSWATALRDRCMAAREPVRFLFKQWGVHAPCEPGDAKFWLDVAGRRYPVARPGAVPMRRMDKGKAGRLLDGQLHDEHPPFVPGLVTRHERRERLARLEEVVRRFANA